jgi:outer membrane receptor protein involved in Fe transport
LPGGTEANTIVVTASKRDPRLHDFPGAVSILDGADLAFGGVGGTEAILARLASLSSTHLGAGRNKLFIRGIADSSFTGPTQATVGQYFGDIRLTYNAPDPDLRLYDMASVEVLEGPQGTLYGAGSLGGIIRTTPNPPQLGRMTRSLTAGVWATQHGEPSGDAAAMINLPLAEDHLVLRLVGYGTSEGGYIVNPLRDKKNINRTTISGGRATLRYATDDGWTVDLGGIIQRTQGDDSQYADRAAPPLTRLSQVAEGSFADYRLGELVIAKSWDGLHFRASTGLIGQTLTERFDASPPDGPAQIFRQRNETRLFTSEARLWRPVSDGFGWVLGASYIHNRTRLDRALGPVAAPVPTTGVVNRVSEQTFYGEASLALLDWLTATAGGRISHTRLSGTALNVLAPLSFTEAQARARTTASRQATSLLPSLALAATPSSQLMLYVRYQQGFRPGGLAIENFFVRRFRSDRVATIEGGFRYGGRGGEPFELAGSLSATRWKHIQADFIDGAGLPSTANIGNGRILSLALSGGWWVTPELRLDAGLAFNDSKVTKPSAFYLVFLSSRSTLDAGQISTGLTPDASQQPIPKVARLTGRIGFDWVHPLHHDLTLRVIGWARYVGSSRLGVGPVLGAKQGDYTDSAITARIGTQALAVSLGITNLSDSVGNRFALGTPFAIGQRQITPLRPRTVRLGIDTTF